LASASPLQGGERREGRYINMTKLLEQAIERVRQLPEAEQDMAAAELIGYLADFPTSEERSAIADGRHAFERGEYISLEQLRHDMGSRHH